MNTNPLFGKHKLSAGEHTNFNTGYFSLLIKHKKEGWLIQHSEVLAEETPAADIPTADYFLTGKSGSLMILPALPAKPLVFKGGILNIAPGQKLTFYLKIPLTVQVYYSKAQPSNLLKEFAVKRLSDTWFGDPFNGEPAFLLGNEFYLKAEDVSLSPFEAICPVTIFNNSPILLKVERLIIRVENMTLYSNEDKVVTSMLAIEYKGKEVISSASYHFSKMYHGEKEDVLAKPRSWGAKNMLKINFHFLRNFLQT